MDARTELFGVAGLPLDSAEAITHEFPGARATEDYRELLADPRIGLRHGGHA